MKARQVIRLIALLLLLNWSLPAHAQFEFVQEVFRPVNINGVQLVQSQDLNGDGIHDLIYRRFWQAGAIDGSFSDPIFFPESYNFERFFIEDAEGDGDLDLFAFDTQSTFLLRNDGLGNFELEFLALGRIRALIDYDQDGQLDLLHTLSGPVTQTFALCVSYNPDGNWTDMQRDTLYSQASLFDPQYVLAADLDSDGDQDFVSYFYDNVQTFITQDIGQVEQSSLVVPVTYALADFKIHDLNHDGYPELLIGQAGLSRTDVLWGSESGFTSSDMTSFEDNAGFHYLDFDADGLGDLAIENLDTSFDLYLSSIGGIEVEALQTSVAGEYPVNFFKNQETGVIYLIRVQAQSNEIHLLSLDQNYVFQDSLIYSSIIKNINSLLAFDVDQDSNVDLMAASSSNNRLAYFPNDGQGGLQGPILLPSAWDGAFYYTSGDIDQNGEEELYAIYQEDPNRIYQLQISEDLQIEERMVIFECSDCTIFQLEMLDFDQDAAADLLLTTEFGNRYSMNLGDGTFGPMQIPTQYLDGSEAQQLWAFQLADFNTDGLMDFAYTVSQEDSNLLVRLNLGNGEFADPVLVAEDYMISFIMVELNGDETADIIAEGFETYLLLSEGSAYADPIILENSIYNLSLQFLDLENDGDQDMLIGTDLWVNIEDGLPDLNQNVPVNSNITLKALFDYNNDGYTDICARLESQSVRLYRNTYGSQVSNENSISDAFGMSIYPNPASNHMTVQLPASPTGAVVQVYDLNTQQIWGLDVLANEHPQDIIVDTASWPSGWYLLKYRSAHSEGQRYLIKVD